MTEHVPWETVAATLTPFYCLRIVIERVDGYGRNVLIADNLLTEYFEAMRPNILKV